MIINFENIASRKYVVQKSKNLWMTSSEITENSFLALIQSDKTLFLKFQLHTFVVNNFANSYWAWQAWPHEIPMVYLFWVQLILINVFLKSASETVFYKVKAFSSPLELIDVLSM